MAKIHHVGETSHFKEGAPLRVGDLQAAKPNFFLRIVSPAFTSAYAAQPDLEIWKCLVRVLYISEHAVLGSLPFLERRTWIAEHVQSDRNPLVQLSRLFAWCRSVTLTSVGGLAPSMSSWFLGFHTGRSFFLSRGSLPFDAGVREPHVPSFSKDSSLL